MNVDRREELIAAYLAALDEPEYDALESVFAPGVVYLFPDQGRFEGRDETIRFLGESKPTSDTDHDVSRYVHSEGASVFEGTATGVVDGEPFQSRFCDVVEFTDDDRRIAKLAVYSAGV